MKEIPLTQGKVTLVDDEDYDYLNQFRWFAHKNDYTYYATRNIKLNNGKRTILRMQNVIKQAYNGFIIDHIDHDGLNNQRCNLRICTPRQNMMNKNPKHKYLGVRLLRNKYISAQITAQGKYIHLGYFKTEESAARAYDNAAKKYFKEFANLNFK